MNPEQTRLQQATEKTVHWRKWGPYLSERQWGTVREDYSEDGEAWQYFPFKDAASRAYRWGEDGIAGISDNHQQVCFAFAFWNEKDGMLKERLFGLDNEQGNHGEDVKELYYYLDNTPTHSYMQMLYKYPQNEFPYETLLQENQRRGLNDPEYELIDTGVFDENKYFDIFVEYAKAGPEDILVQVTVWNRGPQQAKIHVLPQLWLRNVWSWKSLARGEGIRHEGKALVCGDYRLYFEGAEEVLFTENETGLKDGIQEAIVNGNRAKLKTSGTKAAVHSVHTIAPGKNTVLKLRLTNQTLPHPFADFTSTFQQRKQEADTFYHDIIPCHLSDEHKRIQRQAFAGLLWNKQFYHYVVEEWLNGDNPLSPPPAARKHGRNAQWKHMYGDDIFSMPDSWEYPWFASWDLAFQCIPLAMVDPAFAKKQLSLLTREWYIHPNGQIPAYEWNFSDVNPPVLAWAAWRIFKIEQRKHGHEDRGFLEQIFQKLIMNFTWWVNRKDTEGRNVFEGGFLGLDNISIFNRSEQLPKGAELTQSDATSWMAMYCLHMATIAVELATKEPLYEDMASKFFKHFLYIADAINYQHPDCPPLWDEEDGFYYDLLKHPDGTFQSLKIRSMVGLIPLFAVATVDPDKLAALPNFRHRFEWFKAHRADLCVNISPLNELGQKDRRILSLLDKNKLQRLLEKVFDENEFLSPYGVRSVSKYHENNPFVLKCNGTRSQVDYEPGDSRTRLYGGNSNWRGPVWFPLNYLLIEALQKYHYYYGDDFKVECPTGSGQWMNLWDAAAELSRRLIRLFERDESGKRAVYGQVGKFQEDEHFRDWILFHEFFHGETGEGLGASHQTGWTALVAKLIQQCGGNV